MELLFIAPIALIGLALVVAVPLSAVWVFTDAQRRGTDTPVALAWALGTFFVWMPIFVVYLVLRGDARFVGAQAFGGR